MIYFIYFVIYFIICKGLNLKVKKVGNQKSSKVNRNPELLENFKTIPSKLSHC